tara:strand:+ start:3684 stop:4055 length:372 start_codon:yes stop_codon:yes gene_type:complete
MSNITSTPGIEPRPMPIIHNMDAIGYCSTKKKDQAMRGEIRGLVAGLYEVEDMKLDVFTDDDGVHIIQVDEDLAIVTHWLIMPEGRVLVHVDDLCEQLFLDEEPPDERRYEDDAEDDNYMYES